MSTQYFKSDSIEVNQVIALSLGLARNAAPVFTIEQFAKAYPNPETGRPISKPTAKRRIAALGDVVTAITKERAIELGFKSKPKNNATLYPIRIGNEIENLSINQISVRFNTSLYVLKKIKDNQEELQRILDINALGYRAQPGLNNVLGRDVIYQAEQDERVLAQQVVYAAKDLVASHNLEHFFLQENNQYDNIVPNTRNRVTQDLVTKLEKFYGNIKTLWTDAQNNGQVMRNITLTYEVKDFENDEMADPRIKVIFKEGVVNDSNIPADKVTFGIIPPNARDVEEGNVNALAHMRDLLVEPQDNIIAYNRARERTVSRFCYRSVKMVKMDNNVLSIISFDEFLNSIASHSLNFYNHGGSDEEIPIYWSPLGGSLLLSQFTVTYTYNLIGRATFAETIKRTGNVRVEHTYYELAVTPTPLGKNSCFFDSIISWCKMKKVPTPENISECCEKYSKGVGLEEIENICEIMSITLELFGDPIGLKENFIGEFGTENIYNNKITIHFTNNPELHYSAIFGVRNDLAICDVCNIYLKNKTSLLTHERKFHPKRDSKTRKIIKPSLDKNGDVVKIKPVKLNLYYDIETVNVRNKIKIYKTDITSTVDDVKVYSVAWKWSDKSKVECAIESIKSVNPLKVFVNEICKRSSLFEAPVRITLIAFNGSSFDLYPVLKELSHHYRFTHSMISNSRFYNVNAVYKANSESTITCWDPYLMFRGSLKDLASSFGLKVTKQTFDHSYIQKRFDASGDKSGDKRGGAEVKNFDWIQDELAEKIISYNKQDVTVLEAIVNKILESEPNALSFITASSLSYNSLKVDGEAKEWLNKIKLNKDQYDFYKKGIVGGRVQTLEKYKCFTTKDIDGDTFSMIDVVSLYPSQMYNKEYPKGNATSTIAEVEGKMGVYICDIHYQKEPVIVPRKEHNLPLDWNYTGRMKGIVLSSITIQQLRTHFGDDCITVAGGYYWEETSTTLFNKFIDKWMKVKQEQDKLKDEKSEFYKPVTRAQAKLILNSAFGKTIQNIISEESVLVSGDVATEIKFRQRFKPDYDTKIINENLSIKTGNLKWLDYSGCKPQHLGLFILDYTKSKMYNELYSQTKVYYSDTDSALVSSKELKRLEDEGILKIGKELGEYDIEKENITKFYSLAPKSYALICDQDRLLVKEREKLIKLKQTYCVCYDDKGNKTCVKGCRKDCYNKTDKKRLKEINKFLESSDPKFRLKGVSLSNSWECITNVCVCGECSKPDLENGKYPCSYGDCVDENTYRNLLLNPGKVMFKTFAMRHSKGSLRVWGEEYYKQM